VCRAREEEIESSIRIVHAPAGQEFDDDHARSVDAQMKFLPGVLGAASMLDSGPLALADDG